MRRVAIVGPSGAGKSTLARELGERTGLPVYHLDAIHWKPGWVESDKEESRRKVEELALRDEWIIDGNYGLSVDARMNRADTVIFLDLPRRIYMTRVITRTLYYYGTTRPDLAPGCPERFDWEFLVWVWNYHRQSRPRLIDALERHAGKFMLHVLRSPKEVREFLASFDRMVAGIHVTSAQSSAA